MWRAVVMGGLGLALAALTPAGSGEAWAARARAVPSESFLEYRADTVEALALQAERNPNVRARYARHFGIPASRVAQYIRENLVVSYLPTAGRRTVYFVAPGGRIYSRQQYLPKGTRVLTLRNGEPVLRWICGNAMVPELPRVAVKQIRQAPPVAPPAIVSVPAEQVVAVARPVSVPFEVVTVAPVPIPVTRAAAPVVPVPTPVAAPPVPVVTVVPQPVPVAGPQPPQILPIIGGISTGLVEFIAGPTPTPPPVTPPVITELPPPEIPIPEPGSMAAVVLAAMPMALAALRRRRRA